MSTAAKIALLRAARPLVEQDHATGICVALDRAAYTEIGTDAYWAWKELKRYISVALDFGPNGEDICRYAAVWYGEWLGIVMDLADRERCTDDQIRAGRLMWIDQMLSALEAGQPLPAHPPLPPGVVLP